MHPYYAVCVKVPYVYFSNCVVFKGTMHICLLKFIEEKMYIFSICGGSGCECVCVCVCMCDVSCQQRHLGF